MEVTIGDKKLYTNKEIKLNNGVTIMCDPVIIANEENKTLELPDKNENPIEWRIANICDKSCCDINKINTFNFKILKSKRMNIDIGLIAANYDKKHGKNIVDCTEWIFNCRGYKIYYKYGEFEKVDIDKLNKKIKENDVVSVLYDPQKKTLELSINYVSQGIIFDDIDKNTHSFIINMHDESDKIQIL